MHTHTHTHATLSTSHWGPVGSVFPPSTATQDRVFLCPWQRGSGRGDLVCLCPWQRGSARGDLVSLCPWQRESARRDLVSLCPWQRGSARCDLVCLCPWQRLGVRCYSGRVRSARLRQLGPQRPQRHLHRRECAAPPRRALHRSVPPRGCLCWVGQTRVKIPAGRGGSTGSQGLITNALSRGSSWWLGGHCQTFVLEFGR